MSTQFINYKGYKIIYSDYRNKSGTDLIKSLYEERDFFLNLNDEQKYLKLSDFRGAYTTTEFMSLVKKIGKDTIVPKTHKASILGVEGIKKVLFKAYVLFTGDPSQPFDSEIEAKEWLIR
ncbi:MAG: hypothetical protein U0354_17450 [Candidatus Sericytochromatia bacterium]